MDIIWRPADAFGGAPGGRRSGPTPWQLFKQQRVPTPPARPRWCD